MVMGLLVDTSSFQNCSLYKSEGKKFFERNGVSYVRREEANARIREQQQQLAGTAPQSGEPVQNNCEPSLTRTDVEAAFGSGAEARLYFDELAQELACVLSANTESDAGLDSAVCTISEDN